MLINFALEDIANICNVSWSNVDDMFCCQINMDKYLEHLIFTKIVKSYNYIIFSALEGFNNGHKGIVYTTNIPHKVIYPNEY